MHIQQNATIFIFCFDECHAVDYSIYFLVLFFCAALPIVTSGLNASYNVQLEDRFSLQCTAQGVPIPNIIWFKDDGLVSDVNDTNLVITYSDPGSSQVTSTLTVLAVSLGYRGAYTCLATNNAGSDRSTGILTITG